VSDPSKPGITPSEAIARWRAQVPVLRQQLLALGSLADRAGEAELSREARRLESELKVERLRVAFVGEFKAGKSTLINALLDRELLPVKLRECTASVCRVRLDPSGTEGMRLRQTGRPPGPLRPLRELAHLAQDRSLQVEEVEVTVTAAGWPGPEVELVDTPGARAGGLAGEQRTLAWLPRADAVVFVTRADRPLGAAELRLLREHILHAEREDAVLVVNHADALATRGERARVHNRVESAVREATGGCPPILFLSAADARDAQDAIAEVEEAGGPEAGPLELDALEASGLPELRALLDEQLVRRRAQVRMRAHMDRTASVRRRLRHTLTTRLEEADLDAEAADRRAERLRTLQQALARVPRTIEQSEAPRLTRLRTDLDRELEAARDALIPRLQSSDTDAARAVLQGVADRFRTRLKEHQEGTTESLRMALAELVDSEKSLDMGGPGRLHVGRVDVCTRTITESNDLVGMAIGAGIVALFTAPVLVPLIALGAAAANPTSSRTVVDPERSARQALAELRSSTMDALGAHEHRIQTAIGRHVASELDALRRRIDAITAPSSAEHTARLRALLHELEAIA